MNARLTPEATIGPFYPGAFLGGVPQDLWNVSPLLAHHPRGRPIVFTARFIDGLLRPVPSLVLECWQANASGRYRHPQDRSADPDPQFDGFARLRTGDEGTVRLATIKPGAHRVSADSVLIRAPHLRLTLFASGIDRLVTQIFFDDEALNASDPVLQSIPDPLVRNRLVAKRQADHGAQAAVVEYAIEIVLRGDHETPFFDDWV